MCSVALFITLVFLETCTYAKSVRDSVAEARAKEFGIICVDDGQVATRL